MEVSPAVEAAPRATFRAPPERPLPALVMEDAAVPERQAHGLRGTLFYGFSYFAAAALGVGAVMLGITGLVNLQPVFLALGAGAGLWAALQWRLAREVHHFTR